MAKRNIGQNFLVDHHVAEREVAYAKIGMDDVVLEIGPGMGVLTTRLAKQAKQVIAIEIDEQLINHLQKGLPENVLLIHDDALKIDFTSLPDFNKIVSNLPFQISSPITFKFLNYDFTVAVLIYQKEFAERMIAKPKTEHYSRLSVGVYYKAHCELLETIPKTCFDPQPKVDSCTVKLVPRKSPPFPVSDEHFFFDLTRELFNHRRKKIKSTIRDIYNIQSNEVPYLHNRVEELTPEQIGELSDALATLH
jgi:16S rRNA (adenine1518-N6/adenine1519-N6)-dimethyltransferase